ncbi:glutathione S-transferase [Salipiger profundus]|nr:glutathione S-transferase [Salipiger profundus]SFC80140.1 GST-like protein [Salipiger profundus]
MADRGPDTTISGERNVTDLSQFPITARWPAAHPDRIQLYSYPTPNGVKAAIALEEMALPYEAHTVPLGDEYVKSAAFTSLNPNGKIPAIIDPDGPDGTPFGLFESGAILLYLAEKSGRFLGETARERHEIQQWLMFQMGGTGPMFGQLGFFYKLGGAEIEDPRPRNRYINEARRLLGVVETALDGRDWIAGSYSVADMALAPWLRALDFYGAREVTGWHDHPNCVAYLERFLERPAVRTGLEIPPTA